MTHKERESHDAQDQPDHVVKNGRAQWTYITPCRSNGVDTEVLPDSASGQIPVKPGDEVIVEGHLTLTHDAPVRVAKRER